ncbi:MAG TPA: hypothetical protein VKX25_17430 [Bryobacteraceae bacterium]|jgi:hypothetical protein|nr:hypothetical protein [Bryobacteraceae bacterium]
MRETGWVRALAYAAAMLFVLSWIFPLSAGLAKDTSEFPKWWGSVDVVWAFVLALVAFAVQAQARSKVNQQAENAAYRVYRTLTHAIILAALLVMVAGDRITWAHCVTGFLWRTWLGLYILPWWLAAIHPADKSS